ncbi:ATP-binding protein [Streptomyces fildesensis]|uniref:ATP-binding protein n=1 Tax=Streptomyces fildesensis TaxID=375757 RepID=A0ABW8C590_9ACTN
MSERSLDGDLPVETTSFLGRRSETSDARALLASTRVLTLVGPGGVGKTRLALRLAAQVRRAFGDGVAFVDLASLKDMALLPYALANALGVDEAPAIRGQMDMIIEALRGRQMLFVMDNCEHVIDAAAAVTAGLVRSLPEVKVLATSRQPLGVAGEHLMFLEPLAVPDPEGDMTAQAAAQEYPALGLFAERAQAVAGVRLTDENWRDAARLCARLDGLPLAIELAAVSSRVLTPQQMLERRDGWSTVLSRSDRPGPLRHRSLDAAMEWSHELCSPEERLLWARASVFAGYFSLEDAEAVCTDTRFPTSAVIVALAGLVEKSVLAREEHLGRVRYRLLETLSRFGGELLGDDEEAAVYRHRYFYLHLAEDMERSWFGPDQLAWIERMRSVGADLRTALAAHIDVGDFSAAQRMSGALLDHWFTGHISEGRLWSERALAQDPEDVEPLVRARALHTLGLLAAVQGDRAAADSALEECRLLAEEAGSPLLTARANAGLAVAAYMAGDEDAAYGLTEQALAVPEYANSIQSCSALATLAFACCVHGDFARALTLSKQAIELCDQYQERWNRSWAVAAEALSRFHSGDPEVTPARARDLLVLKRDFHDTVGVSTALILLSWTTIRAGDAERGAVLVGISHRYLRRIGLPDPVVLYKEENIEVLRCREALGDQQYETRFRSGFELGMDAALDFALGGRSAPSATAREEHPLTAREQQVAACVGQGLSNKEIAAKLVISLRTAEGHVQRILTKLDFTSRTQLAAWSVNRTPET